MARWLTALAAVLALFVLACNGDGGQQTPAPQATGSPTPVTAPTLPPAGDPPVEALRLYLRDTGMNGDKGDLTDPIDCAMAEEAGAEGEFCIIVDAGHYAPALAIVFVINRETEHSWQVHVDLDVESSTWEVTNVDSLSAD